MLMDLDMDGIYRVFVFYCHLLGTSTSECGYNHVQHTYYQNTDSNYIDFTVHPHSLQPPKGHQADFPEQEVVNQVITLHVNNILKSITKYRGDDKSLARTTSLSIFFFQFREQVVVRRGRIRRIGWVIKT
jgi:hypothetical protein